MVVGVSGSVFGPVSLPEFLSVIVRLSVRWDPLVSEADSWGSSGVNGSNKSESEFHLDLIKNLSIIINLTNSV